MTTRVLISDDGVVQVWRINNDQGQQVGTDLVEIPTTQGINLAALQNRAQAALATNTAFLAVASPTNAQTLAQVKALTKECSALIRLMLGLLDSTDGA